MSKSINLIGISGKIGSGKDTIAKLIQYSLYCKKHFIMAKPFEEWESDEHKEVVWKIKKFSTRLKELVCTLTGAKMEDLEDRNTKEYYRPMMIMLGKVMRDWDEGYWIEALFEGYKYHKKEGGLQRIIKYDGHPVDTEYEVEYPKWIISDVRYHNEAEYIKLLGGLLIRVNRLDIVADEEYENSPSETELDNYEYFNYVINNSGTKEELTEKVKEMLKEESIT